MAAPHIPNLNTLRSVRGGRGRGRALSSIDGSSAASSEVEQSAKDKVVQQTDQDASISRLSAVELGYLNDPFAGLFASSTGPRRFPIINRGMEGTYVRTTAIDKLVDQFLSADRSRAKQIISLGAGSDTRFFRLKSRFPRPRCVYHEMDFSDNTKHKVSVIKRSPELCEIVGTPLRLVPESAHESDALESPEFYIHPVDLRALDANKEPPESFRHIDRTLPTLIISECCLVYLDVIAADIVASYFTKHLFPATTGLGLIVYEPIKPHDAFGKVMVSNLAARGIVMQTLRKYGSLEAQAARMKAYGFGDSRGADVNELWETGVDENEKERVSRLEMVDEVEEWQLLAGHYCVAWGWIEGEGEPLWQSWKTIFH